MTGAAPPPALDILCVEDDADIGTIIAMALALDPGIALRTAARASEAVRWLNAGPLPDVILLDLHMPDLPPDAVLEALAAVPGGPGVAVILLTADARPHDRLRSLPGAIRGVIAKPFDPLTLAVQVRRLIGTRTDGSGGGT